MTNENLERLIKVLDGTQFEIENRADAYVWVSLKDPWEGVEFVECITDKAFNFKEGKIYRLAQGRDIYGIICIYNEGNTISIVYICYGSEIWFKPSTEEAYVNQLKAKSFELYGDIKYGDSFEDWRGNKFEIHSDVFTYSKIDNRLFLDSWIIHEEGKWAKKLTKRIEVVSSCSSLEIDKNNYVFNYKCKIVNADSGEDARTLGEFISDQIEKYLNDEVD
jgi:hypothetical protein